MDPTPRPALSVVEIEHGCELAAQLLESRVSNHGRTVSHVLDPGSRVAQNSHTNRVVGVTAWPHPCPRKNPAPNPSSPNRSSLVLRPRTLASRTDREVCVTPKLSQVVGMLFLDRHPAVGVIDD